MIASHMSYMARIKDCVSTMISAGSQYIDGSDTATSNDTLDIREFSVHKRFLMGLEVNYEEYLPLYYHFIENYMLNGTFNTFQIMAFTPDDIDELILTVDCSLRGEIQQFMDKTVMQQVNEVVRTQGFTEASKFAVKSYTDLPDSKEDLMNKYIEDKVNIIKQQHNSDSLPEVVVLDCLANVLSLGNPVIANVIKQGYTNQEIPSTEEEGIHYLQKAYNTLNYLNKPMGRKLFTWLKNDGTPFMSGRVLDILRKLSYSLESYIHAWNTVVVELSEGACSTLGKYSSIIVNKVYALNSGNKIIGIRIGTATRYVDINIEVATKLGIADKWAKKLKVTKVGDEYLTKKEVTKEIRVQDISDNSDLCAVLAEKILQVS